MVELGVDIVSKQNLSIFISGATGSLGKTLLKKVIDDPRYSRVIVFSRDELKQHEMKIKSEYQSEKIRWFIGDIRDADRLKFALKGVDEVIHTAALKQVDSGEYNPMEFIKTNVIGTQNLIDASLFSGVSKFLGISTDKASSPINLYGATKLTSDKLIIAANSYAASFGTRLSVVRYGNVIHSRGSVVPVFQERVKDNLSIRITDKRMTRFWISLHEASNFVLNSLEIMKGEELYIPKMPSIRIIDLATAISESAVIEEVGIRPGEKIHEELISTEDGRQTFTIDKGRLAILPSGHIDSKNFTKVSLAEFNYRSDKNDKFLTVEEIRTIIKQTQKV